MEIYTATQTDLDEVAALFDQYRQFYKQPADYDGCRAYIEGRMAGNDSTIFVAKNDSGQIVAFTQLYPTFCSVARSRIFVLYDLFVAQSARRQGIGRALMHHATEFAKQAGASRLQLETGMQNTSAQALYESLGYTKDRDFYMYHLYL